jgi:hypothetical protein
MPERKTVRPSIIQTTNHSRKKGECVRDHPYPLPSGLSGRSNTHPRSPSQLGIKLETEHRTPDSWTSTLWTKEAQFDNIF